MIKADNPVAETIKGRPRGYVTRLARDMGMGNSQVIYRWAKRGWVPPKYAIRFCRLTGARLEDVCQDMVT